MTGLACEVGLRVIGVRPWKDYLVGREEPTIVEEDAVLGWRNKGGKFVIPAYTETGCDSSVTISAVGDRSAGPLWGEGYRTAFILGCSFTYGWGLSDEQTYPWKVQKRLSGVKVLNYGSPGYSTFQSLLVLEREINRSSAAVVIYGFIEHHEDRNVAPAYWVETLNRYSRRGHTRVPFCTLNGDGSILRHNPYGVPGFPFKTYSSLAAWLEGSYLRFESRGRLEDKRQVTEQLLIRMDAICKENKIGFAVALLSMTEDTRAHYLRFLSGSCIEYIDCVVNLSPDMVIPGEGHPNEMCNSYWASSIASWIKLELNL